MSHYNTTRQEAAEKLKISLRSVDRYLKAWKMRSKKKGKIVYVHTDDIENFSWGSVKKSHIVITESQKPDTFWKEKSVAEVPEKTVKTHMNSQWENMEKMTTTFEKVYTDLRNQIIKKDEIIQNLSIKIGQNQEQVKHSISISEHNRTQMLLEESKENMSEKVSELSESNIRLEKEVKDEKFEKTILIVFVFILLSLSSYFWFTSF